MMEESLVCGIVQPLFAEGLDVFSASEIALLRARVFMRERQGKQIPYVRCLIRDKDIQLKPEEVVRQLFAKQLMDTYHYAKDLIRFEYPVSFGREKKSADIVVFEREHPDSPYIIVETKKPKLKDGKDQLKSYCHATGAPIAVWTNGKQISYYHRKNPNYFEDIRAIPTAAESLADILQVHWTIEDLQRNDKLLKERKSLKGLILEMEDEVLANAGVDVFEEMFKLIFTKLYDEMQSGRNNKRYLEFRNDGSSDNSLKQKIQTLFDQAKTQWQGVFSPDSKLELTASHLSICVSSLQDVKLFNSNLEVIDDAFEYLMSKSSKGEKGQYFTPRYVIDLCVKMLRPTQDESMIDTAAGSCGFPVHCIFHVWEQILRQQGLEKTHLFTAEQKPVACTDYVKDKVFAIDFDEKAVRVARTLNLIAGDGQTNVLHLNSLDWPRWDERGKDETWLETYFEGWGRLKRQCPTAKSSRYKEFEFDILMANPPFAGDIKESQILSHYELANNAKGKRQSKVGRDILFIERNLDFLKPGGRMAIVLPQGRFNNASDAHIRAWLAERGRILAVVGLHGNVFKPHTGTKTSVLFLQKWHETLCPKRDDYPIFFATMQRPSKDNSGEKIYLKGEDDRPKLDAHGHLIVDHDLFNHDGLTQDGIAEAFAEFAKREKLSFFLSSDKPFDAKHYQNLLDSLEISETFFSEVQENKDFRLDSQFWANFLPKNKSLKYLKIGDVIKKSQYGISIGMNEEGKGFPIYRMNEIHDMFCDCSISKCANISHGDASPFFLNSGDVLFNRTNSYDLVGRTGIFYKNPNAVQEKRIFASYLVRLITNADVVLPEYLTAYLNTKYAICELRRRARQSINQTNINPEELKEIEIPILGMEIQEKIQSFFQEAFSKILRADKLYAQSQSFLLAELGLENYQPNPQNIAIRSLQESFVQSGRLDAEYYQPKYDELLEKIKNYVGGYERLGNLCQMRTENITPNQDTEHQYIELSHIGSYGEITGCICDMGSNLPTRARYQVKSGDVLLSSIEGSLSSIAMVSKSYHNAFCSTGFYPLYSTALNAETLLLFFKNIAGQMQLKRGCNGTILTAINMDELSQIIIPKINPMLQVDLQKNIQESFCLRTHAKNLLGTAKRAVEIAIEQDEACALGFLQEGA